MEPLDQTEDVEKQSAVIKGETLGEKKEENVEIKTEVKEEYGEPASLSQVKLDPLEIKTEEVKEENVDGIIVCSLIQNEIKREIQGVFFNWPPPDNVSRLAPPKFAWTGPP